MKNIDEQFKKHKCAYIYKNKSKYYIISCENYTYSEIKQIIYNNFLDHKCVELEIPLLEFSGSTISYDDFVKYHQDKILS